MSFEILNYSLSAILFIVCFMWIFLTYSLYKSIKFSPYLDVFEKQDHGTPKVSVIIPARNEEKNIKKCLDSFLAQTYENYEIVIINDSSEDKTGDIIAQYAKNHSNIVAVTANPKPDEWMGKSWACIEGYKQASGELLLFTDADTIHPKNVISLTVSHFLSCNLDALTVIPRLKMKNIWGEITFNTLNCMTQAQFSPLQINDPSKKIGIFFGSFFILNRKVYEAIGTHEGVKSEIIEDGELGQKTKDMKYKLKIVRGEHMIQAKVGSDGSVWDGLNRVMMPTFLRRKKFVVGMLMMSFLLLLFPFLNLGYSSLFVLDSLSSQTLFAFALFSSFLTILPATINAKKLFALKIIHGVLVPIGGIILVFGAINSMIQSTRNPKVAWKKRNVVVGN